MFKKWADVSRVQMLLLFHFIVDFQLYIHWIHRVILVVILLMSVVATVALDIVWSDGWRLMYISLMVNHLVVFSVISLIFDAFKLKCVQSRWCFIGTSSNFNLLRASVVLLSWTVVAYDRRRLMTSSFRQPDWWLLEIMLSPLLAVDSGTVLHLTLDPHKLCLFSVTI